MFIFDLMDVIYELVTEPRNLWKLLLFVAICVGLYFLYNLLFPDVDRSWVWDITVVVVSVIWLVVYLIKKGKENTR